MTTTVTAPDLTGDESHPNRNINNSYERHCDNVECNAVKLLSMVPKRKASSQFITEPIVMEKPLMVDGYTVAFQVGGNTAKWSHITSTPNDDSSKTVYRIIPNTHVHVVNYVVVDADDVNFHKIQKHEPHTMQKLLSSQKESAEQMLKKLMTAHGTTAYIKPRTLSPVRNDVSSTNLNLDRSTSANMKNNMAINSTPSTVTIFNNSTAISLPASVHPNLKITAVATVASPETGAHNVTLQPYINTVPLSNLQNPTTSTNVVDVFERPVQSHIPSTDSILSNSPMDAANTLEKSTYEQMETEIQELRRKVAILTDVQSTSQQQEITIVQRATRRPRKASIGK